MPSYPRRRRCTWFFRWKRPERLAVNSALGELICSPKTADYRTARRRAMPGGRKGIFDKLFPAVTIAQLIEIPIASDLKTNLLLSRHYARAEQKTLSAERLLAEGRTPEELDRLQSATAIKHVGNPGECWSHLVEEKENPGGYQKSLPPPALKNS